MVKGEGHVCIRLILQEMATCGGYWNTVDGWSCAITYYCAVV